MLRLGPVIGESRLWPISEDVISTPRSSGDSAALSIQEFHKCLPLGRRDQIRRISESRSHPDIPFVESCNSSVETASVGEFVKLHGTLRASIA
jgi:hypothetical protein